MKKQFLLVVASVITMTAQAQDGQQATLVHGATTTIFDGTEALQQALSAAAHGDSIRLSAGDFAAADITKAVHIRGAGFNASVPDSLTQLNGDFTVSVDSTAGRMSLEGVFSSSTMQVGLLRNACFQNCRLGTVTPKNSASTMRGTAFVKCKVVSGFNLSANSSASCHNSYIGRPICMNDSNSVFFFNNCMIRGWNEYLGYALKSSYLLNSILIWESSPKSAGNQDPRNFFDTSNRVYNVLGFSCWELHTNHAYSMFDNVGGYDTGDHWWLDPRYTFIFASGSSGWNYSDSETYELTETAQTTYIGLDGTQIGMHGGAYPFDNGASYPEVATDNSTRPMILQAYKNTLDGAKEANYPVFRYDSIYSVAETLSSDQLIAVFDELCTGIHTSNFMREAQGTEYPIFYVPTHGQVWTRNSSGNGAWIRTSIDGNGQQALTAYVDLDQDAVLRYEVWNSDTDVENMLYIDDQPARFVSHAQAKRDEWYQFARVPAGRHTLRWVWTNLSSTANNGVAYYGGLYAAPLISVNLETAGSLGNEVLYHVDNIDQVRRLKITGPMNSDDFARIDMMTKLMELDLSETDVTSIPAQQFDRYDAKKNSTQWLYKVTLPHNLVSIGNYAFRYSYVYEMDFPQTLKSIGNYALESTHLYKAVLPDSLDTLGEGVFYNNQNLQEVILPDSMTLGGEMDIEVVRRHTQIQIALYLIGFQLGFRTWIAQNDKGIIWKEKPLLEQPGIVQSLNNEGMISAYSNAVTSARFIDCIWFKNGKYMPAVMEVEHTTGVTSGLTRMKGLQDAAPSLMTRYVIVAPDDDREKVVEEANRPQFITLDTRFFAYSSVEELYYISSHRGLRGVSQDFLDCYMEEVVIK